MLSGTFPEGDGCMRGVVIRVKVVSWNELTEWESFERLRDKKMFVLKFKIYDTRVWASHFPI